MKEEAENGKSTEPIYSTSKRAADGQPRLPKIKPFWQEKFIPWRYLQGDVQEQDVQGRRQKQDSTRNLLNHLNK